MTKNDDFGRDLSWYFTKEDLVLKYYDELTTEFMNEKSIVGDTKSYTSGVREC
jgi:hypothetical protein